MTAKSGQLGLRSNWQELNHVAIVVRNVGKSLNFYANILGMEQIRRPDFDRFLSQYTHAVSAKSGACLSMHLDTGPG